MAKVYVVAHIPSEQIEGFLKVVRQWEGGRKDIEMAIRIEDKDIDIETAADMMKGLTPEFAFHRVVKLCARCKRPIDAPCLKPSEEELCDSCAGDGL